MTLSSPDGESDLIIYGIRFRQTTQAPEDYVEIHPFQVAKLLNDNSQLGIIDVVKVPSSTVVPGSTAAELFGEQAPTLLAGADRKAKP